MRLGRAGWHLLVAPALKESLSRSSQWNLARLQNMGWTFHLCGTNRYKFICFDLSLLYYIKSRTREHEYAMPGQITHGQNRVYQPFTYLPTFKFQKEEQMREKSVKRGTFLNFLYITIQRLLQKQKHMIKSFSFLLRKEELFLQKRNSWQVCIHTCP